MYISNSAQVIVAQFYLARRPNSKLYQPEWPKKEQSTKEAVKAYKMQVSIDPQSVSATPKAEAKAEAAIPTQEGSYAANKQQHQRQQQ